MSLFAWRHRDMYARSDSVLRGMAQSLVLNVAFSLFAKNIDNWCVRKGWGGEAVVCAAGPLYPYVMAGGRDVQRRLGPLWGLRPFDRRRSGRPGIACCLLPELVLLHPRYHTLSSTLAPMTAQPPQTTTITTRGHFGGALGGAVFAWLLGPRYRLASSQVEGSFLEDRPPLPLLASPQRLPLGPSSRSRPPPGRGDGHVTSSSSASSRGKASQQPGPRRRRWYFLWLR